MGIHQAGPGSDVILATELHSADLDDGVGLRLKASRLEIH